MSSSEGFELLSASSSQLFSDKEKFVLFRIPKDIDISKLNGLKVDINSGKSQALEIKNSSSKDSSSSNNSSNLVMYRDLDSNSILRPIVLNKNKKTVVGPDFSKTFVIAHDYVSQLGFSSAVNASVEEKKEGLPIDPAYSKIAQYPSIQLKFNTSEKSSDASASNSSSKIKRKADQVDSSNSNITKNNDNDKSSSNSNSNSDNVDNIDSAKKSKKKKDKK